MDASQCDTTYAGEFQAPVLRDEDADHKRRCTVPILAVFVTATFVSSASSMAGGLVMYFRSLESLEDTVKETSKYELNELEVRIFGVVSSGTKQARMLNELCSEEHMSNRDDTWWVSDARRWMFAQVRASPELYSTGIVAIPRDPTDPKAFYASLWGEPLADGTKDYGYGHYDHHLPRDEYYPVDNTTTPPTLKGMNVHTRWIHPTSGRANQFLYTYNVASYVTSSLGTWQPETGGIPEGWDETDIEGVVAQRYRSVMAWVSQDGTAYAYSGVDLLYEPPPPPHPWSGHRGIFLMGQFVYNTIHDILKAHSTAQTDTTVVLYDTENSIVYATTTGQQLVTAECMLAEYNVNSPMESCTLKMRNLSRLVQDAHAVAESNPTGSFLKASLDGEEHFVRKKWLYHTTALLWMRKTSVVEAKVQDALTLLIIFTAVVLAFDLLVSLVEIVFVALPLRRVASVIQSIGKMETDEAQADIAVYNNNKLMVTEMSKLFSGMSTTVARLQEYRTFMPDAVLKSDDSHRSIAAPEGTIALVFTDIVRSTDLWENFPTEMARSLDLHNKIMRSNLKQHSGYEVKTIGDAFMAAFQSPRDAVGFMCDVQVALLNEDWPEDIFRSQHAEVVVHRGEVAFRGLRVRMGGHHGEVNIEVNPLTERCDYRGPTVNKSARIEGQALAAMSAVSKELMDAALAEGPPFAVKKFRMVDLKGIGETQLFFVLSDQLKHREDAYPCLEVANTANTEMSRMSDSSSVTGSNTNSARRSKPAAPVAEFERHLRRVHGALATLTMQQVDSLMAQTDEVAQVLGLLNTVFQMVTDLGHMTSGRIENLVGTQVTMSWNYSHPCSVYQVQSFRFCGMLQRRKTHMVAGLVIGPMCHGFTGSSQRKFHAVLGAGARHSPLLSQLAVSADMPCLAINAFQLKEPLLDVTYPVDIWEGEGGFQPYAVVEAVLTRECCELSPGWDHEEELPDAKASPPELLRKALLQAAELGTDEPLRTLQSSYGSLTADVQVSLARLLAKSVLVTPAKEVSLSVLEATCRLVPEKNGSPRVFPVISLGSCPKL